MSLAPASILSYYPTHALLDEILSAGNYKKLNIFVDLKNNLQSLYLEHAIVHIVENSIGTRYIDTSIFSSLVTFLSFHKLYSIKRNIDINYYIFFESGTSYFHTNIDPRYKQSRRKDDLYGLDKDKRDKFFEVVQKNLMMIEKLCNKMPNIKVIRMANLDADFIPYYLLRNNLISTDDETISVTYSNDHDMYQTIGPSSVIFCKTPKVKRIIKQDEGMSNLLKSENNFPDSYLPLAMSVLGDTGDDIAGIKGIGAKTLIPLLEDLIQMVGGMNLLYENVFNSKPIFIKPPMNPNKHIDKILEAEDKENRISKNLKLSSFELLSMYMDDPIDTEMIKKKNHLMEVLNSTEIIPYKPMMESLAMIGVELYDDTLENIYHQVSTNYLED